MLTQSEIADTLNEYVETIVPAMFRRGYHLTLVKGGPEYPHLSEQSHFTHIVNGVFALARFLQFVADRGVLIPRLDASAVRRGLAAYTVHEVHKDRGVERSGLSEFDIPLERVREEYLALGLEAFAGPPNDHLLRAANVHKRSPYHGDLLRAAEPDALFIRNLVRTADAMASVQTPEEAARSLRGYLADLSPAFAPQSPTGRFALYFHELRDVRGVLTNAIHETVSRYLEARLSFFPLLFFATGTLYIGPAGAASEGAGDLIPAVTETVFGMLQTVNPASGSGLIRQGLSTKKNEAYVYILAPAEDLLEAICDIVLKERPNSGLVHREIDQLAGEGRQGLPPDWRETVEERLGIRLLDPKAHGTFNELWSQAYRYLLYVHVLARDLNPVENPADWMIRAFGVPQPYADRLREEAPVWAKGGIGKYALVVAYHFLRGPAFADRPAEALPPEEVLGRLHRRALEAFRGVDTEAGRRARVAELGLRPDLEAYLRENLRLSFAPAVRLEEDGLADALRPKRKGHTGKVCSLCNRRSEHTQALAAEVLEDFGRVFSNRVLPAQEAPQGNRLWCPVCHLEFILRKATGVGLPFGVDYKNTRRIYFYVLPTYSFTPEHLRLWGPLLAPFQRVTNVPVRDQGRDDPGLPRLWLERRTFDPYWMEKVQEVLEREAERIARQGGRSRAEERLLTGAAQKQPHYYLLFWERSERAQGREEGRLTTRTEAWAKALFAAILLSGLTGCKVYVTERLYLPVADPADLKATVMLDGPPPALRGLLSGHGDAISLYGRERGPRSGLERALDLAAALWVVTTEVHASGRNARDKQISERLETFNTSPLAGATFYREFARLNQDRSPSPALARACEVLLEYQGGDLMNLAEKIAQKSLEIALPRGRFGRGMARQYEWVFRETVSAMRKARQTVPELREASVGAGMPSEESIAELKLQTAGNLLKTLHRHQQNPRSDIFVRPQREELSRLVGEFVDLVVDELYLGRAGGSFARFLRLENIVADGIYFYTDRHLSRQWEEVRRRQPVPETEIPSEEV